MRAELLGAPRLGCPSPALPKAPWAYGAVSVMAGAPVPGAHAVEVPLGLVLLFLCLIVTRSCECKNRPPPPLCIPLPRSGHSP